MFLHILFVSASRMGPHIKFIHMTKFSPQTMSVASVTNIRYDTVAHYNASQSNTSCVWSNVWEVAITKTCPVMQYMATPRLVRPYPFSKNQISHKMCPYIPTLVESVCTQTVVWFGLAWSRLRLYRLSIEPIFCACAVTLSCLHLLLLDTSTTYIWIFFSFASIGYKMIDNSCKRCYLNHS